MRLVLVIPEDRESAVDLKSLQLDEREDRLQPRELVRVRPGRKLPREINTEKSEDRDRGQARTAFDGDTRVEVQESRVAHSRLLSPADCRLPPVD